MVWGEGDAKERLSHSTLQRARFESPNCPECPCFKQFSDVYTGWEGGKAPALILASVKVFKKAGLIEGVSTTKHVGRQSLEEHPVAHQPPPILPDTFVSFTGERLNLRQLIGHAQGLVTSRF